VRSVGEVEATVPVLVHLATFVAVVADFAPEHGRFVRKVVVPDDSLISHRRNTAGPRPCSEADPPAAG